VTPERTLPTGAVRFIVKPIPVGPRKVVYGVYDRATGSFPGQRPGLGKIKQAHPTQASADIEADRLRCWYEENA
jgi:hypothetical protein